MSDNPGIVTLDQLRENSRKIVQGPSGFNYKIRRLSAFEFVGLSGFIPSAPDGKEVNITAMSPERVQVIQKRIETIVLKGVVEPTLETTDDLPAGDALKLFEEITALSGYSQAQAEAVRPT